MRPKVSHAGTDLAGYGKNGTARQMRTVKEDFNFLHNVVNTLCCHPVDLGDSHRALPNS